MKSKTVAKMNIKGTFKAAIIYYAIVLLLLMTIIILDKNTTNSGSASGIELQSVIFLFICGLNSFKSNFYFAKGNNVSRKTFIKGILISIVPIALVMSIIDIIIYRISKIFIDNVSFYEMSFRRVYLMYADSSIKSSAFMDIINLLLFQFALCIVAYTLGFVIRMIYYRSNKIMKIVVSVLPIALLITYTNLMYYSKKISTIITKFLDFIFGFNPANAYAPMITFLVVALILASTSFLLVRKAPIKEK
jgi:hypothetical protein